MKEIKITVVMKIRDERPCGEKGIMNHMILIKKPDEDWLSGRILITEMKAKSLAESLNIEIE